MKHFVRSTLVALSLFSVPVFANPPQQPAPVATEETITLQVGGTKELQVSGLTRVAVGDPEVADIDVEGGATLRIEGRKAGETILVVWTGEGRKAYRLVVQG